MFWVRLARGFIGVVLMWPLLAAGSCAVIAQTSVVNGFFNAVTPMLVDHVRADLGLSSATTTSQAKGLSAASPTDSYRDLGGTH